MKNQAISTLPTYTEDMRVHSLSSRPLIQSLQDDQRLKGIGVLRIIFGLVWAVAAALKWQPAFQNSFADQVKAAMEGQPESIKMWIAFWAHIISINPHLFAMIIASTETALAICFIFGIFTNAASLVGIALSLGVWSVAEGFGGPYVPGTTVDIGTAFPYAVLSAVLLFASSGRYLGLDSWLTSQLGRWGFLAAGSLKFTHQR